MTALIDLDSILYQSVYKCVSIKQIRELLQKGSKEDVKQAFRQLILDEAINRTENKLLHILTYLNSVHFEEIDQSELYITTCSNNFRNKLTDNYKAKRKKNNYVWMVREYYRNNGAFFSDTLEADDLIADRCKELNTDEYVIVSIDKDLRTIGGYIWSYYQQKSKDIDGNYILNENGGFEKEYKQKNIEFVTDKQATSFFYQQMLMGDATDNIIGLKGIGVKRSEKLINASKNEFITVAREYIKRGRKEDFKLNHRLLKLGK